MAKFKGRKLKHGGIDRPPTPKPCVAWKHDCAALLTNDVELWIDACPHCGKPRNAPQPVEREPIGYLYCGGSYGDELADWEIVADQHQCDKLNEHHGSLGKEAKLPIYTAPQPIQAQAGAVTDAQVLAAVRVVSPNLFRHGLQPLPHDGANTAAQMRKEADTVRKMLEAAHGIKGKTK